MFKRTTSNPATVFPAFYDVVTYHIRYAADVTSLASHGVSLRCAKESIAACLLRLCGFRS